MGSSDRQAASDNRFVMGVLRHPQSQKFPINLASSCAMNICVFTFLQFFMNTLIV